MLNYVNAVCAFSHGQNKELLASHFIFRAKADFQFFASSQLAASFHSHQMFFFLFFYFFLWIIVFIFKYVVLWEELKHGMVVFHHLIEIIIFSLYLFCNFKSFSGNLNFFFHWNLLPAHLAWVQRTCVRGKLVWPLAHMRWNS